jgi:phosphoribosyl-AMP cyclohydrolase
LFCNTIIQIAASPDKAADIQGMGDLWDMNEEPLYFADKGRATKDNKMIELDFNKTGGLLPAIVQDNKTGEVLMLAYTNRESWEATLETGKATYYSRSRDQLWVKGETSGHVQIVKEIRVDCDNDTVLLKVEQLGGAACHKGYKSCFYRKVEDDALVVTHDLVFDPKAVYKK